MKTIIKALNEDRLTIAVGFGMLILSLIMLELTRGPSRPTGQQVQSLEQQVEELRAKVRVIEGVLQEQRKP